MKVAGTIHVRKTSDYLGQLGHHVHLEPIAHLKRDQMSTVWWWHLRAMYTSTTIYRRCIIKYLECWNHGPNVVAVEDGGISISFRSAPDAKCGSLTSPSPAKLMRLGIYGVGLTERWTCELLPRSSCQLCLIYITGVYEYDFRNGVQAQGWLLLFLLFLQLVRLLPSISNDEVFTYQRSPSNYPSL